MRLTVDGHSLSLQAVRPLLTTPARLALALQARAACRRSRRVVERALAQGRTLYGVNTGFGRLATTLIPHHQLRLLQHNLIRSHAAGVGDPLSEAETRLLLLFRINALAKGYSGVRPSLVEALIALYNRRVWPVIPEQGSVGASGDLAPLAHLALVLIGEGEAMVNGRRLPGRAALRAAGLPPVRLEAKEGLALINGTQAMLAVGTSVLLKFQHLLTMADVTGALTLDALGGLTQPFDRRLHRVRPHPGQLASAANLRALLSGRLHVQRVRRVQDAYSLRCMPQIHGAARDAAGYAAGVFEREMNAATDNPLVFAGGGREAVLSGGNFHGQPLAIALDTLAIAMTQLAVISERRIERLLNPDLSGLPPFLAKNGGVESGCMIVQTTAAALTSENKVYAHPASVDSIPTSANQEDVVSMGMASARKARLILTNTQRVLGCELFCAAQALNFSTSQGWGIGTKAASRVLAEALPQFDADRPLAPALRQAEELLTGSALRRRVESATGPLL